MRWWFSHENETVLWERPVHFVKTFIKSNQWRWRHSHKVISKWVRRGIQVATMGHHYRYHNRLVNAIMARSAFSLHINHSYQYRNSHCGDLTTPLVYTVEFPTLVGQYFDTESVPLVFEFKQFYLLPQRRSPGNLWFMEHRELSGGRISDQTWLPRWPRPLGHTCALNISRPDDANVRHWTESTSRYPNLCSNAELLSNRTLEQNSVKFLAKYNTFHSRICSWKCRLHIGGHFVSASTC